MERVLSLKKSITKQFDQVATEVLSSHLALGEKMMLLMLFDPLQPFKLGQT